MTILIMMLAFVDRPGVVNPVPVAHARRLHRGLVNTAVDKMTEIFAKQHPPSEEYDGRMLGVSCHCTLNRAGRYATLELRGVPIGGRLAGTAWFMADGKSVQLDPELDRAVARRLITIYEANHRTRDDTIHVILRHPLLGRRRMVLHRTKSAIATSRR